MEILFSRRFIKRYAKLTRENKERVDTVIDIFQRNPFDARLVNHKLTGSRKDMRAVWAGYDLRLLYVEQNGYLIVLFVDVGTHDEVY